MLTNNFVKSAALKAAQKDIDKARRALDNFMRSKEYKEQKFRKDLTDAEKRKIKLIESNW